MQEKFESNCTQSINRKSENDRHGKKSVHVKERGRFVFSHWHCSWLKLLLSSSFVSTRSTLKLSQAKKKSPVNHHRECIQRKNVKNSEEKTLSLNLCNVNKSDVAQRNWTDICIGNLFVRLNVAFIRCDRFGFCFHCRRRRRRRFCSFVRFAFSTLSMCGFTAENIHGKKSAFKSFFWNFFTVH